MLRVLRTSDTPTVRYLIVSRGPANLGVEFSALCTTVSYQTYCTLNLVLDNEPRADSKKGSLLSRKLEIYLTDYWSH